jgi:glycosyltransferase involved in cell wall biosynthesis
MRVVSVNYSVNKVYTSPQDWLSRINFSAGILTELAKRCKVIAVEQTGYKGTYAHGAVQYEFVQFYQKTSLAPLKLHRFIKKLQPDVVMVHGLLYPLQVIQLRMALGNRVKIWLVHHAEKPFVGIKRWLQQQADRRVDGYQFTASSLGEDWVKAGIISNISKVHPIMEASSVFTVMDKQAAKTHLGIHDELVYLWVGRLDANKDPLTVVKSFIHFADKNPGAVLYMIYHTDELLAELMALARGNDAIRLIGAVPHHHMQYWYNSADFIVSGSHYEGSGIAVCEAMSCGCIPIVTAISSFVAMTDGGNCGFLYPPANETVLLNVLTRSVLINRAAMRAKVLHRFTTALSFDAIAITIYRAFGSL